jgi:hypothetical protein
VEVACLSARDVRQMGSSISCRLILGGRGRGDEGPEAEEEDRGKGVSGGRREGSMGENNDLTWAEQAQSLVFILGGWRVTNRVVPSHLLRK